MPASPSKHAKPMKFTWGDCRRMARVGQTRRYRDADSQRDFDESPAAEAGRGNHRAGFQRRFVNASIAPWTPPPKPNPHPRFRELGHGHRRPISVQDPYCPERACQHGAGGYCESIACSFSCRERKYVAETVHVW